MTSADQDNERFSEAMREFLAAPIVVGAAMLPSLYADSQNMQAMQVGFRSHALTGESLVSEAVGGWRAQWFVVALNELDDPFFVDLSQSDVGYPVYFAVHGIGHWTAIRVASGVARFAEVLRCLQEAKQESTRFLEVLDTETDRFNVFWREVYEAHLEAEGAKGHDDAHTAYDPKDYESGHLIVTSIGPNKLQVVRTVSKALKISLKDALTLADGSEFSVGSGTPIQFRRLRQQLEALGTTLEFRPSV